MRPHFPLYVVSKGRWQRERRLTIRALEEVGAPYRVVVEEEERDSYADAGVDPEKLLVLDPTYQREYDTFDDLGDSKSRGPGPARNFAWEHSLSEGHDWHWVMDDNIRWWARIHQNSIIKVDATAFRVMEDFCLRYSNVAMAGPNYEMFVPAKQKMPPFVLNTRIYSCNLVRGDAPFRWRGRYNEDTDLSLRMLKAGWVTVQFNAFVQHKVRTQLIKGGNTEEFYAREGTFEKSKMLVRMHPDVTRAVWKFGRWHHHVDYSPFKGNKLRRCPGVEVPAEPDNYGLRLVPAEEADRRAEP